MAGKSNTKWKETMLKRFNGNVDALHDHMATIAAKGGRNGIGYKFAHGKADPILCGTIGGLRSKRTSKKLV